jgi:serine/threonine protein kinase/WD40 repeat protein
VRTLDRNQRESIPPELHSSLPMTLPKDIAAAQVELQKAGTKLQPHDIDFYQLGALLCRLITGQSADAYRRSPRAKGRVPAALREVLELSLGCADRRLTDISEFLHLLPDGQRSCDLRTAAAESGDVPEKPDTSPSIIANLAGSDTAISAAGDKRGEAQSEALPFDQLGHYEIQSRIGRGGMGEVYLGYERSLDRKVAIKVLPADLERSEEFVRRFQAEATAAARLVHPNVIQIYFIGKDAGHRFFAMQYVEGEPLGALLERRGRLSVSESLDMLEQILAGLGAAHEQGLIHRDIKPGNILWDRLHRRALLADFGLVKSLQAAAGKTATGVVMGTVEYIAPEQGRGLEVDHRCDLYSVGVLTYQLLSGCLPFEATSPTALIFQHVYEPPRPLTDLVPDLPSSLVAMVAKLLAKAPDARHATAAAVLSDVRAIREGRPLPSGAELELRNNPQAFMAVPEARERRTLIIQAPRFDDDPRLPASLDLPLAASPNWRGRWVDYWRDVWHSRAPEWVRDLQNTQQQVDGAVFAYERRRDCLQSLLRDAEAILADLKKQESSWQSDSPTDSPHQLAELQRAISDQNDELGSMRLRLAKVAAALEQLRSQRDLLNARLRVAEARVGSRGSVRRPIIGRYQAFMAIAVIVVAPLGIWSLKSIWTRKEDPIAKLDAKPVVSQQNQSRQFQFKGNHIPELERNVTIIAAGPVASGENAEASCTFALAEAGGSIQPFSYSTKEGLFKHYRIDGVPSEITALSYSSDGKHLASAHEDGTIHVWDTTARRETRRFTGASPVTAIVYSIVGEQLLSATKDGWIRVWDVQSEQLVREFRNDPQLELSAYVLAWRNDGSQMLTGARVTGAESMALINQPNARSAIPFTGNKSRMTTAVAFSANPDQAVSFAGDFKFHVWNLATRTELRSFGDGISYAVLTQDGRRGLTRQKGNAVAVWDIETGKQIASFPDVASPTSTLAICTDGQIGIVVDKERSLRVLQLPANAAARPFNSPDVFSMTGPVGIVAFSSDGEEGIAAAGDTIRHWNIGDSSSSRETNVRARVSAVSYSSDSSRVLYATGQATLTTNFAGIMAASVLDFQGPRDVRRDLRRFEGFKSPLTFARFIDLNRRVLTACEEGILGTWDIQREQEVDQQNVGMPIHAMAYGAAQNRAYIAADDSTAHVWSLSDKQEVARLQGHEALVRSIALSDDGLLAVTGSDDRTARIWDLNTNQSRTKLSGHTGHVNCVAISHDGR